ncbi:MAG: GAF domain-containing protein, partial [Candidatus Omnitrophica bacterium]|nr:GAF domain-containing protein [Candidatus Omnitrophota bacterium]
MTKRDAEIKRLKEELAKRDIQLEMLSQVSSAIASNKYLNEILELIVTMTAQTMGSKICSLMLLDEKEHELIIVATQSLSEAYRNKPPIKVGQSISGRAVKEKRPITVLDVTKEKGYMYPEVAKKEKLISLLSVPMMVKDRVIGVINSYTSKEHKFRDDEVKVLQAVANQAAVTIENTNLFDKAKAMEEALETRKALERA